MVLESFRETPINLPENSLRLLLKTFENPLNPSENTPQTFLKALETLWHSLDPSVIPADPLERPKTSNRSLQRS